MSRASGYFGLRIAEMARRYADARAAGREGDRVERGRLRRPPVKARRRPREQPRGQPLRQRVAGVRR